MPNTATTYLPPEVAEYFTNGTRKISSVTAQEDFSLSILFDNGERRVFDMKERLKKKAFVPIRDWQRFKTVYIDDSGSIAWDADPAVDSSVVWSNHIDLCPDACYIYSVPESDRPHHLKSSIKEQPC